MLYNISLSHTHLHMFMCYITHHISTNTHVSVCYTDVLYITHITGVSMPVYGEGKHRSDSSNFWPFFKIQIPILVSNVWWCCHQVIYHWLLCNVVQSPLVTLTVMVQQVFEMFFPSVIASSFTCFVSSLDLNRAGFTLTIDCCSSPEETCVMHPTSGF